MAEFKENKYRVLIRKPFDKYFNKIPFPKISPNLISISTIFTSILAVLFFKGNRIFLFFLLLLVTLLLDWIDGTIARKYGLVSYKGWVYDKVSDRISELILFSFVWLPGLILVFINCIMVLRGLAKKASC